VGNENAGAKQAQKRRNRLNHRKYPLRPDEDRTTHPAAQSKEFPVEFENRTRVMIWCNSCREEGADQSRRGPERHPSWNAHVRNSTSLHCNHSFTTPVLSPFPPPSGCGMFIR
jgi:hypothetical protein